jgi:hypothetical protein
MPQVSAFLNVVGKTPAAQWMVNLFRDVYLHKEVVVSEIELSSRASQKRALFAELYKFTPKHRLSFVGATPSATVHDEIQYARIGRNSCIKHKFPVSRNSSFRTCTLCGTVEYIRHAIGRA